MVDFIDPEHADGLIDSILVDIADSYGVNKIMHPAIPESQNLKFEKGFTQNPSVRSLLAGVKSSLANQIAKAQTKKYLNQG